MLKEYYHWAVSTWSIVTAYERVMVSEYCGVGGISYPCSIVPEETTTL